MKPIPKSGYYWPNKLVRVGLLALEDVMGKHGVNAILNVANLPHLINNYPPDNMELQFDFADISAIFGALGEIYGMRGSQILAVRAGRAIFSHFQHHFSEVDSVSDPAFKDIPLHAMLHIGLMTISWFLSSTTSDPTVEEKDSHFIYTIYNSPFCWGRKSDHPECYVVVGLLKEALKWVSGGQEFHVNESRCIAMGDPVCEFVISKDPIDSMGNEAA